MRNFLKLAKNNVKEIKTFKFQFFAITIIIGLALSLFIGLTSSAFYQTNSIKANNIATNREDDILQMINPNSFFSNTSINNKDDYRMKAQENVDSYLNGYIQKYLIENTQTNYNFWKYSLDSRAEFSIFFGDDYNKKTSPDLNATNECFSFSTASQDGIVNKSNPNLSGISKDNTTNIDLPSFNGQYYSVYVSEFWAKHYNFSLNSIFHLYNLKFKIVGWINSSFYANPISLLTKFPDKTYKNPFIILNKNDFYTVYSKWSGFAQAMTSYYLLKFANHISDKNINRFNEYLMYYQFNNNILRNTNLQATQNNLKYDNLFFPFIYNSKNSLISLRYKAFFTQMEMQKFTVLFITLAIILLSFIIITITIRQKLEQNRSQIGILKSLGYKNISISLAWIGSTLIISTTAAIFTIIFTYVVLAVNKSIISPLYLYNNLSLHINYLYALYSFLVIFLVIGLFSVSIAAFTTRQKPIILMSIKQSFSLRYIGSALIKKLNFIPFVFRYGISSFVASGARAILFVIIIFITCTIMLLAIFLNQLAASTYNNLKYPYHSNYVYDSPSVNFKYGNDSNSVNNLDFSLQNIDNSSTDSYFSDVNNFYKNDKNKVFFNMNVDDNGSGRVLQEDNIKDMFYYFISNKNDIANIVQEQLYVCNNSFIINGKDVLTTKYNKSNLIDYSKIISRYLKDTYSLRYSSDKIYNFFISLQDYYVQAPLDSKINIGFYLYNNKTDIPIYCISPKNDIGVQKQTINGFINVGGEREYVTTNINTKYQNKSHLFNPSLNIIDSQNKVSTNIFKNLNFNYIHNENTHDLIYNKHLIPITISQKLASYFNIKVNDTFDNCIYAYIMHAYTNNSVVRNNNNNFEQYFLDKVFLNEQYTFNNTDKFYVKSIMPSNNTKNIYCDLSVMEEYMQYLWTILPQENKYHCEKLGYFPGGQNWISFDHVFNQILSNSNNNYFINNEIGESSLAHYNGYFGTRNMITNPEDVRFINGTIKDQIEILTGIFLIIFIVILLIFLATICVFNTILVKDNQKSISILKLFGYNNSSITFMYMSIMIPLFIIFYFLSSLCVYYFFNYFIYVLSVKTGFTLQNNYNILLILIGLFTIFISYIITLLICRNIIAKIPTSKIVNDC